MNLPVHQVLFLQLPGNMFHSTMIVKPFLSSDPTSYQLRKHLSHLLHMKELGARDVDRWNRECLALLLQIWRKELELTSPKNTAVTRTTKSSSKGSSGTKSTRHSVLKQIYGNCPLGTLQLTSIPRVLHQYPKWNLITMSKPPFRQEFYYSISRHQKNPQHPHLMSPAALGQNWFHYAFYHFNPESLPAKTSSAGLHY